MDLADLVIKILSTLDWNAVLGVVGGAMSGWLVYKVQLRKVSSEEAVVSVDNLLKTLKYKDDELRYKDEQLKEVRAQMETMEQKNDMVEAELRADNERLRQGQEDLEDVVQKALARIDHLEGVERAYRRLIRYARALEKELTKLGVDWDTLDVTRMMFMADGDENGSGAVVHDDLMAERERKEKGGKP